MTSVTPSPARIVERIQESSDIFTLRLRLEDGVPFKFSPGQFNMLYLMGLGEVPISIVSDPQDPQLFDHTIRIVGRVTKGLAKLKENQQIGVRGPFGRGWPLKEAQGKDLLIVTGGLGCAPVVAVINYLFKRREQFGSITILQGVKHHNDLIWRERYQGYAEQPNTRVALAADVVGHDNSLFSGNVVELFCTLSINANNTLSMFCGPEIMMHAAVEECLKKGMGEQQIWLSLERNMHCANGLCGHCQLGPLFVCKDGPVFRYDEIKPWFYRKGF